MSMSNYITPGELAKEASVPRQMIYNYLNAGRIRGVRQDKWLISREDADEWLRAREEKERKKYEDIQRQLGKM